MSANTIRSSPADEAPAAKRAGGRPPLLAGPLTEADLEQAVQIAGRLRGELRHLLQALPPSTRGASGMARYLGVDRSACQRLLTALAVEPVGPEPLVQIAGVRALVRIIEAARAKGVTESAVVGFESAVRQFGQFLDRVGGYQRVLADRLKATSPPQTAGRVATSDDPDLDDRSRIFDAARRYIGRWSRLHLAVGFTGPARGDPTRQTRIGVSGAIGHRQIGSAVPFVYWQRWLPNEAGLSGHSAGLNTKLLLKEFCSDPLPPVATAVSGVELLHTIDPPVRDEPFDVVFAVDGSGPMAAFLEPPSISEDWTLVNYPAEAMLFDSFIHRDLARRSIPGLSVHLWHPNVVANSTDHWETRHPRAPRLQVLGAGLALAGSALYPRHVELLSAVFRREGWNPDDFIGYRCEVRYPAWRLGYRLYADFRAGASQEAAP